MPLAAPFVFDDRRYSVMVSRLVRRMPRLSGAPIRIQHAPGLRDYRGPVHAGAFLRERRIAFDCTRAEFPRIFAHEAAHFLWLRLGNPARKSWEVLLASEKANGELGWSSEWRKSELTATDRSARTRRWREYCCEAFCDTAAWLWSGVASHPEFTLAERYRRMRRRWFAVNVAGRTLSI